MLKKNSAEVNNYTVTFMVNSRKLSFCKYVVIENKKFSSKDSTSRYESIIREKPGLLNNVSQNFIPMEPVKCIIMKGMMFNDEK